MQEIEESMDKLRVTIGIPAYNEEKNIRGLINCLLTQELNEVIVEEVIVISSGSEDNTNRIIEEIGQKDKRVKIIIEPQRQGKAKAINRLIKSAESKVIVLESADTLPAKSTLEELCLPFQDRNVGMVGGRPIPLNGKKSFIDFSSSLMWQLHHFICEESPKFGEIVAFRNIIPELPPTAVDEEMLAHMIKARGYLLKYVSPAICYNRGPNTFPEFLKQRRRIFAGHLELRRKTGYSVPTLNGLRILRILVSHFPKQHLFWTLITICLEIYARFLGLLDFYTKKDHTRWVIAKSTKELNLKGFDFNVGLDC